MSVFHRPGLYLRNPRGGVDQVAAMRLDGFSTIAINVRDHQVADWDPVIARAVSAGVTVLPWARCLADADVVDLCATARDLGKRVLVNAENELFGDDPEVTLPCIERETRGLDAALSMLPWAGDLDLSIVSRLTMHLQLFPQENPNPLGPHMKPRDSRAHAYARGARRVEFMLGVHGLDARAFPARQGGFWGYTADDMATDYSSWSPENFFPLNIPFTGPLYGPRHSKWGSTRAKSGTAKALKTALHNAGFGNFTSPDLYFNRALEQALENLQRWAGIDPVSGAYGKGTYEVIRRLASATPGETYALTPAAEQLLRDDARLAA